MTAEDDRWLLSSLGPIERVRDALALVRADITRDARHLARLRAAEDPDGDPVGDDVMDLIASLTKLCSLLAQVAVSAPDEARTPGVLALLDRIELHQQTRADLSTLDDGGHPRWWPA